MLSKLANLLTHFRITLAVASLCLAILLSSGAKNLVFDASYRVFFSNDDPHLIAHDSIEATYTNSTNVAFLLIPGSKDVFTAATMQAIEILTRESWSLPYSIRVDSIVNYQYPRVDGDDLVVAALTDDVSKLSEQDMNVIRDIAINEEILINNLISAAGDVSLVNVRLSLPKDDPIYHTEVVKQARILRDKILAAYPNLDIHILGEAAINNAFNELAKKDARSLYPLMVLIIVIGLFAFFSLAGIDRKAAAVFTSATMLVVVAAVGAGLGYAGHTGTALNNVNSMAPIIIMMIAIADCVHLIMGYILESRKGLGSLQAIRHSIINNMQPLLLTSFTTAIGFFCLNFSTSPPFASLGNMVGVGISVACLLTFGLLPFLVCLVDVYPSGVVIVNSESMVRMGRWVLANRRVILFFSVSVVCLLATQISKNDMNDSALSYFDDDVEFKQSVLIMQDTLTGLDMITYSMSSAGPGAISEPSYLEELEAFKRWYLKQSGVVYVSSYSDILKTLSRSMNGGQESYYKLPENRELAAQYLLLYEMSLPFGMDLNTTVNLDKSATRFSVFIKGQKAKGIIELERRADAWLHENTHFLHATPGTGLSVMFSNMGQRNIEAMMSGNLLSLALITLLLIMAFGSLKYGLFSLIPNLAPSIVAFGLWGAFSGEVNLGAAAVFVITLGIVVDDTVHFTSKYVSARRQLGMSPQDAVEFAFASVGPALVVTSLVLAAGFSVLALSKFHVNTVMGILVTVTILAALVFDLLLLPALLVTIDRVKGVHATQKADDCETHAARETSDLSDAGPDTGNQGKGEKRPGYGAANG